VSICPSSLSRFVLRRLHSQGTGAVTLAALMSAVGVTKSTLADQRIVVFGAGSAGLGITRQLRDAMVAIDGTDEGEATKKFWLVDKQGLLREALQKAGHVREGIEEFVRPDSEWPDAADGEVHLLDVVKAVKPTVLIGCSTHAGAFGEDVLRAMHAGCKRPIVFPLSNPSKLVEVDPKDANEWTEGQALLATGSPFPPCKMPNGKDYIVAECNSELPRVRLPGRDADISQTRSSTPASASARSSRARARSRTR
jgi:malate dehydrogenase (oxaloacetate-decarboxylating)